ncbi:MAG: cytochrome c maturation protein CcmE [Chloroflexi bacterium]|jgi:cytochrome c-type biogenesis protein CcmE|nr:cytochrome c maturation protein CcmE [Chloroflexota bacterium]MBT7080623.1 cytochrome c maturation protein CcmE [Chloroflexota bacterium]MBT7289988.1 cytochrome c maturation protein CcmE [Chloroflexota bacterium]
MLKRKKFVIGGVVLACAMASLLFFGLRDTTPHYTKIGDLLSEGTTIYGQKIKVDGWIVDGSIVNEPMSRHYEFVIYDEDGVQLEIVYDGSIPDNFEDGKSLQVTGEIDENGFTATQVLTQCASKYKPADQE